MKKVLSLILTISLSLFVCAALTGCEEEEAAYTIGIVGENVDADEENAVHGFKDSIRTELGDEAVAFVQKSADNKAACENAVKEFKENGVDLIFAYGENSVKNVAKAEDEIPVIAAGVADYVSLLGLEEYNGVIGGNVSGINSYPSFDDQLDFIREIVPGVKTVAILYCDKDKGASYKASMLSELMESEGIGRDSFVFENEEDVEKAAETAARAANAVYIISGKNTNALAEKIAEATEGIKTPIIGDNPELCQYCCCAGIYTEDYKIGEEAGKAVSRILTGIADISKIQTGYAGDVTKAFNEKICEEQDVDIEEIDTREFVEVESPEEEENSET